MKILVSAYACDPYQGSEPGVGWSSVCRIAKKHEVYVITDSHNRSGWERAAHEQIIPDSIHVRFLRNQSSFCANRLLARMQSWLNYYSFNNIVLEAANSWHNEINFDVCHQVTIAGWRVPSPLWQLPIPFIWGPIGGAGYINPRFRRILSLSSRLFEILRDLNTSFISNTKSFKNCIKNCSLIFVANEETKLFLEPIRQELPMVYLPIVSISNEKVLHFLRPDSIDSSKGPLRLFAGGNMEGRKGVSLALKALSLVKQNGINFKYIVAGGGPEIQYLKKLTTKLGLDDQIEFNLGYHGDEYVKALHRTDVYFLPSLRESTPVTLLEAYLAGCYPVVADMSAQGEIVRKAGGIAVSARNEDELVKGLADGIIWCHHNRDSLQSKSRIYKEFIIDFFSSERYDIAIDKAYDLVCNKSNVIS